MARSDEELQIADEKLLEEVLSTLSRATDEEGADEEIAELAAVHDGLLRTQRNFLAERLLSYLEKRLNSPLPLDNLSVNILSLTDPYFVRSDFQAEAQMLLVSAFDTHSWKARTFEDLISIGNALAELTFTAPGSRELWEDFYKQFADDENYRNDALDVALAGLASVSVEAFAATANLGRNNDEIADRWEIYLLTLIRENGRDAVQNALAPFLARAPQASTRGLRALAEAKGIRVEPARQQILQVVSDTPRIIPRELRLAHEFCEAEKRHVDDSPDEQPPAVDPILHVIHSDYADNDLVEKFQLSVRDLIWGLDGSERLKYQDTTTFAELPADGTLQQKLIYAFPTYLTSNKRRHGYSVFGFGRQRRLGALFFRNTALLPPAGELTLVHLLREMKRNHNSRLYCLQNFAMAELVHQCLAIHPEIDNGFDKGAILPVSPSPSPRRHYVPEQVGLENPRGSVFIFDLAGRDAVIAQINSRATRRRHHFEGVQVVTLEHDLKVPVGIGLNRYASEWAIQEDRWRALRGLAAKWAGDTEFCHVMNTLGVDVEPESDAPEEKREVTLMSPRKQ